MGKQDYSYEQEVEKLLSNYEKDEIAFYKAIVAKLNLAQTKPIGKDNFIITEEGSYGKQE